QLMATIKKSALRFRAFDAQELPRLSLHDARDEVGQSLGVVAHLLDPEREGALVHNARCALVCGLAMAEGKVVAMLQENIVTQPIDYRDVVIPYGRVEKIPALLDRPIRLIVQHLQSSLPRTPRLKPKLLEEVDLG